jgi:hypothetical protein
MYYVKYSPKLERKYFFETNWDIYFRRGHIKSTISNEKK